VFSAPLNAGSLSSGSFSVTGPNGATVPGSLALAQTTVAGDTVVFTPAQPFVTSAVYTVSVQSSLKDANGASVGVNNWVFTTSDSGAAQ
jgi:hypothetical protein